MKSKNILCGIAMTVVWQLGLLVGLLADNAVVQAQNSYSTNADGSIYTYSTNADGSANIVAYAGPPWVVSIPTNINGLTVTAIGTNAFYNYTGLTSVTIPNSVTSIGEAAFDDCPSLKSVTIGNGVTKIGEFAFDSSGLTSITVDASNPAYSSMSGVLFDKAKATLLQFPGGLSGSYTIPNSVTNIGEEAFELSSLTSVIIPNSVTSIGDGAFNVSGLTSVTIPNSVTSIGDETFSQCYSLTNVTIPNSVTNIGEGAFYGTSLTSVTIPNSVTSIGDLAFQGCGLTSITIPNNVTSIGDGAFDYCTSLTSVTILNSVIGETEFAQCYSLTNVTIGNSVTSIGEIAFFVCTNLISVHFTGNAPSPTNDSFVFYADPATVYYLPGTTGWGAMFDGLPTAPGFLPNPLILNNAPGFGVQPGGFGFTISWATNASVVVEACTNLANPVWIAVSTNALTSGTNYFSDPQWTNYPARFYRVTSTFPAFTVGGTVTGLASWDSITLQDNGGDDLTLSTNGTFTFPTALPTGHAYSVTLYTTSGQVACTFSNGSGTISGANVTNVAVSCHDGCPAYTGNLDLDMYNAAVSDGTANGGVPAVMYTENGGPFRVTTAEVWATCSIDMARIYAGRCVFTHVVGTTSCSSTTLPAGTPVIQFGGLLECGFGPYGY